MTRLPSVAMVGAMTSTPATTPLALLIAIALTVAACASDEASDGSPDDRPDEAITTATTSSGVVRGAIDGEVVRYLGIPYAQPPVDDLRFEPPQPVEPWDGELDATEFASMCMQQAWPDGTRGDEDCLYLNVTAPAAPSDEPRPVMVWLHGGGFYEGDAIDYDARRLVVEGDVIVVTVAYRLGALGVMAVPGMDGGGTFALADQQEALRFVQDSAAAFGGDPDNVTVFGESAGGTAVCHHLASPTAEGLFHRAIIMSAVDCGAPSSPHSFMLASEGDPSDAPPSMHIADVEERHLAVAAELGCDGDEVLACLRDLPAADFVAVQANFTLPAVGGDLVPEAPIERLDQIDVPVLAGFNRDEARIYAIGAALLGAPHGPGTYEPAMRVGFGDQAEDVLAAYPLDDFDDDVIAWSTVYTDATFACPQLHANDVMATATDVYAYEFADRTAPSPLPLVEGAPEPGATHSAELAYLFDRESQPIDIEGNPIPLTDDQEDLAAAMAEVWTDFARTGEAPVDVWSEDGASLVFADGATSIGDPAQTHRCEFWGIGTDDAVAHDDR